MNAHSTLKGDPWGTEPPSSPFITPSSFRVPVDLSMKAECNCFSKARASRTARTTSRAVKSVFRAIMHAVSRVFETVQKRSAKAHRTFQDSRKIFDQLSSYLENFSESSNNVDSEHFETNCSTWRDSDGTSKTADQSCQAMTNPGRRGRAVRNLRQSDYRRAQ